MDVDFSFGSYHSKTEASGNALRYTRSVEIKELSVPVSKMEELKRFYRMIASDERNTAVLRPAGAGSREARGNLSGPKGRFSNVRWHPQF
jgi:hypothetical protein